MNLSVWASEECSSQLTIPAADAIRRGGDGMTLFPFGFYILQDKRLVHVGNDLEAQKTVRAWMEDNPDKVLLGCEIVGPEKVTTKFLGWNAEYRSLTMDQTPFLFEATVEAHGQVSIRRLFNDYDAALLTHADLVQAAKRRLH